MEESMKNLLFALDLVNYIIEISESNDMHLDLPNRKIYGESPFQEIIGEAVFDNMHCEIESVFEDMHDKIGHGFDPCFARERARGLVADCFKDGYHPHEFIRFCRLLCSIAYVASEYENIDVCRSIINAIFLTLEAFVFTREFEEKGGWDVLIECAKNDVLDFNARTEQWREYIESLSGSHFVI